MIQKKSCDQSIIINIYISKDYKASLQEPLILSSPLVKKANRRLYVLRQLKKCKVLSADIVHIYCTLISLYQSMPPLSLLTGLRILLAILRMCKKRPFPSFGLVFHMKQLLTKLHYPLFLTVGQSRVLNL